ncbi:sterol desaturase family protein [Tranquillimonas alkanivorans]|uniref:Sterol desaturase/sphingolipid hydroxylase, fatty acid hydroxylase superfamily n=1 Tax=Tranquillimonas alkanivorans TaxID=441119 RepID=A0A1I5QX63_9RHOB|nr:sterol desaturase family protein [Tranquillimonas alkanivorans]SFP50396.1 Sterol desaturase/sphingolipid hydroxylase, fatty acid hydroxylase superfamily [Tranquillimonas alkanivorans]
MKDLSPQEVLDTALRNAEALFGGVTLKYAVVIGVFVGTTLALAWIAWRLHYVKRSAPGPMNFLRFLFPRSVYLHRSTWVDIQLIVINQLFSPLTLSLTALGTGVIASATSEGLGRILPGHDPSFSWGLWSLLLFTLALALVSDLATYVVHRLYHTIPALWEIHKVHHSAEVMSPLTIFRIHPLYDLAARALKALLMGPLQGLVFFAWAGPVDAMTAFGANLVFAVFHMFGAGLRHSHVWLSYGPWLERVFISPAQHQIHHSVARKHWDKNFGQIFALWDWVFGSLYVPKGYEELKFGITGDPSVNFSGVAGGLVRPVVNGWLVATGRRRGARPTRAWRRRQERENAPPQSLPAEE